MGEEDTERKVQKGLRLTELAMQEERSRLSNPAPAFHGLIGGSVPFFQNGHACFPAPWPPVGKESLLHPLSDSITRHAASGLKEKPVINIDGGNDARTEKRLAWEPDEDLRLVSAWLNCWNDPINGNSKKNEQYWGDVLAVYNSTTSTKRKRKVKHLRDRFQKIKRWVGLFCCSWKKATTSVDASGQSDEQLRDNALKFYLDDYKEGPFTVMHCWKVLRDEPKWHALLEDLDKSNKRKLDDDDEAGNNTPMLEYTIEQEHSVRMKEAKKQCNAKGKGKADGTSLDEHMKKYIDIHAQLKNAIKSSLRPSGAFRMQRLRQQGSRRKLLF